MTATPNGIAEAFGTGQPKELYTADFYIGKNIVASIQISAEDKQQAMRLASSQTKLRISKGRMPKTKDD